MDPMREALRRVVVVANGKGGVGKTTIAAQIVGIAAKAGHRVLAIDLDPQGNLGEDLGYNDGRSDDGDALSYALMRGKPLEPVLTDVRSGLDVISGGSALTDLAGAFQARLGSGSGKSVPLALAHSLAPLAPTYDLIVIDTPPGDAQLQTQALAAARWALFPTAADTASIRGLEKIATRIGEIRHLNPTLAPLGAVLFDVATGSHRIRATAAEQIAQVLGGGADLFNITIRSSKAAAQEARIRGLLIHELAEKVEGAEPFWRALREGKRPDRLPGSAPALAEDFLDLVEAILATIVASEQFETVGQQ